MKKFIYVQIIACMVLLFAGNAAFADKKIWNLDPSHTKIQFTVSHLMISSVTGDFGTFGGKVVTNDNDFTDAEIAISIDVRSIDSRNGKRDNHLRSEHFFDVSRYPTITFKSTSVKKIDDKNFKLIGDFTIHGVTKSEELNMYHGGTIKDQWGHDRAGFKITGQIQRFDYDLKWNELMETGGAMVGKTVDILCNVELVHRHKKSR